MLGLLGHSQRGAHPKAENGDDPTPQTPRWFLISIKAAVSASLMYWILHDTDFSEVWLALSRADGSVLFGAYCLCFIGYFIGVNRWHILLKAQGVRADRMFLVRSHMVAIFFNNLLPSTIGGDVVKAHDSTRFGITRIAALAVIMVDRFLGFLALAAVALVAIALSSGLHDEILIPYAAMTAGVLLAGAGILFLGSRPGPVSIFTNVTKKLPVTVQRLLGKVVLALAAFQGRKWDLWMVFALALLLQGLVVLNFYLIGKALHLPIGFGTFFLVIPMALFIMLAPISINGVGVREGAFVFLLGLSGVAKPDALAVAWISYAFLVIQGITGGLVYAFRK